jgi:hypothetical protein
MHARVTAVAAGDHGREYEPVFRAELRSGDVYGSRLCGATLVKGGAARGTGTERGVAEAASAAGASQDVQAHLWRALMVLIPDDSVVAAVVLEEAPTILAVAEGVLLETTVSGDDSLPGVRVKARPIDRGAASVVLAETLEDAARHPAVPGTVRVRQWTFDPGDGGRSLSWTTRQVLFGGFESERVVDRAERLARHLAAASGWTLPTKDATGPDWE